MPWKLDSAGKQLFWWVLLETGRLNEWDLLSFVKIKLGTEYEQDVSVGNAKQKLLQFC